jgi:hypothetical protein
MPADDRAVGSEPQQRVVERPGSSRTFGDADGRHHAVLTTGGTDHVGLGTGNVDRRFEERLVVGVE